MYCPNCNKNFTDEFAFCDNCGGKLENEKVEQAVKQEAPKPVVPAYTQPPVAQAQPTYQYSQTPPPAYSAPVRQAPPVEEENKKISKTVSFGTWMGIHFLNIIPFMFGVLYTVLVIISTLFTLDNPNPVGIAFLVFAVFYVLLLLIWAIGKPKARSLKNYAKATLLMTLIVIVLMVIAYFVLQDMVMDIMEQVPGLENLPF